MAYTLAADGSHNSEHDSESDDDEVVETSPCGRWEKYKKQINVPCNVPGIDSSYLAMDTEEGVEVIWNELMFSEIKAWKKKEEIFKKIFDNLSKLIHPNIVTFHKYWVDVKEEYARLIFISEYMTSGSLQQFLKKTKANVKYFNIKAWKRWCQQILSALSFLHTCEPPVVHGNLNCETIHIQHNGLVKIETVAPDAIHNYVKSFKHPGKHVHFVAPEYDGESLFSALSSDEFGKGTSHHPINCAADVYSFGIVALEMATLHWVEKTCTVTPEMIKLALDSLEDSTQREFIEKCLQKSPENRPTVHQLLMHPILLEVYSLKLLAAHALSEIDYVKSLQEFMSRDPDRVMAEIVSPGNHANVLWLNSKVQPFEVEKFLEEIKTGLYPLTGMESRKKKTEIRPQLNPSRPKSPEDNNNNQGNEDDENKPETRLIIQISCAVKLQDEEKHLTLTLRFEDKMNRQLSCKVSQNETSMDLACELVKYGLINENDCDQVANKIEECLHPS
ncbi:nuclear receptor-binding protein isoform X1 [Hydra vulgaris]|nr:nuclear receptor-binding protein [Hydra vulgaris]